MGKLVQYVISIFFKSSIPRNSTLGLDDPEKLPELLLQTQHQLSSNNRNTTLNTDIASKILQTKNGLSLDVREPLWELLVCMINKPDSYLINYGLVALRTFSHSIENTFFIFQNTPIFNKCKEICSRGNPKTIENLFCLISRFFYVVGEAANQEFIRNSLFEFVSEYFFHNVDSVRISAMKCISNCLVYEVNSNLIDKIFTRDFIIQMINSARDNDEISLREKDEIIWILVNLAQERQEIGLLLFASKQNMEFMIDILSITSKTIAIVELNILSNLFDTRIGNKIGVDIFSLFIKSDGVETIENLMNHQCEYIAQSSQSFYYKYLQNL